MTQLGLDHYLNITAPVAQLDRVTASEAVGHRFESCRVRHHFGTKVRTPSVADGATSATNINDPVIAEAPVGDPSFPTTTDLRFLVTCEGLDLATKRPESLKLG